MRIGVALWALLVSALVGRGWSQGLSQCGLPCGEVTLADGGVWNFTTPGYPGRQKSPDDSWCLCEWIIHAPAGKNVILTLNKDFHVNPYFFVSDKGGGEGVPLAVCGSGGYWPPGNCDGVVAGRGSLHLGLFNYADSHYAVSLSVTTTEEAATEPMKPINGYPDMMNCTCPNGIYKVSPEKSISIVSPGYPNRYPNYCNLADFATEEGFDYLSVYDGRENGTGKDYHNLFWCNKDSCANRTVASSSIAIVFVSDATTRNKGFSLDVSATDCTPCDVTPCRNGGSCTHSATEAFCHCTPHYTGTLCEDLVCEHGGTSGHNATVSWCTCPPHYSGQRCEVILCENGGTRGGNSFCYCAEGSRGTWCQDLLPCNNCSGTLCERL